MQAHSAKAEFDFNSVKAKYIAAGDLYEDPEFPPVPSSIYKDQPVSQAIKWLRPGEISEKPHFISGTVSRFDLDQGELGNCWFVAAAANLAVNNKELFHNVVPMDQTFEPGQYAGMFRFRFWRFGEWKEVVVDDRLPTKHGRLMFTHNNEEPDEFWAALMEKAYAKLKGSYGSLVGGRIQDALIDFTGGISEDLDLNDKSKITPELFDNLVRNLEMNSMIGCAINKSPAARRMPGEERFQNGLVAGHAYSVTGIQRVVDNQGNEHHLLRIRNPWGNATEWTGPWSDNSELWGTVPDSEKKKMDFTQDKDGEFWMSYEDWKANFTNASFCHLSPSALTAEVARKERKIEWKISQYHGIWVNGVSAGGCGNPPNQALFWTNPQYHIKLDESDDADKDGKCTIIVSLIEKYKYKHRDHAIGFRVHRVREGAPELIDADSMGQYNLGLAGRTETYSNAREVTCRMHLDPGHYVIIVSTFQPGKEGEFLLRIFSELGTPKTSEIDDETGPCIEPIETEDLRTLFKKYAGEDNVIDCRELRNLLNEYYARGMTIREGFSMETARSLLTMMDTDMSGRLEWDEFDEMMAALKKWKSSYRKYDIDNSNSVSAHEMRKAFIDIGFSLSRKVLQPIVKKYGGKTMSLTFEDFTLAVAKVYSLFARYKELLKMGAQIDVTMFMSSALYS